jgi:hypothetical protein
VLCLAFYSAALSSIVCIYIYIYTIAMLVLAKELLFSQRGLADPCRRLDSTLAFL